MQAIQSVFKGFVDLIGPGQILEYPRENDGYAGKAYTYWRFTFRPNVYKYELYPILAVVLYLVWWRVGRAINRGKARAWIESALPKIQENFTSVSPDPKNPKNASFPLIADGAEAYLSYASGRRGTLGMHSTISLVARHDPISLIWNHLISPIIDLTATSPADTVTITVSLRPESTPSTSTKAWGVTLVGDPAAETGAGLRTGVWGVLRKQGLSARMRGRWDLSFPLLQPESTIPTISDTFAVLSESLDITTALLAPSSAGGSGLKEILEDAETSSILKSLVIADLPPHRPYSPLPHPSPLTITLVLALPPSQQHTETYLQLLFNLIDLLTPSTGVFPMTNIKPETVRKIKSARVKAWKEIKEEYEKENPGKELPSAGTAKAVAGGAKKVAEKVEKKVEEEKVELRGQGIEWVDSDDDTKKSSLKKGKKNGGGGSAAEKKAAEEKDRRNRERKDKLKAGGK